VLMAMDPKWRERDLLWRKVLENSGLDLRQVQIILNRFNRMRPEEGGEVMSDPCACGGEYEWQGDCGKVCYECENHKGLARCFCGWSLSGGDGRRELEEMGEVIEPDDY